MLEVGNGGAENAETGLDACARLVSQVVLVLVLVDGASATSENKAQITGRMRVSEKQTTRMSGSKEQITDSFSTKYR